jgi:predicted ribosome quality control (RQC) complex YloA/Tae2 family protein
MKDKLAQQLSKESWEDLGLMERALIEARKLKTFDELKDIPHEDIKSLQDAYKACADETITITIPIEVEIETSCSEVSDPCSVFSVVTGPEYFMDDYPYDLLQEFAPESVVLLSSAEERLSEKLKKFEKKASAFEAKHGPCANDFLED